MLVGKHPLRIALVTPVYNDWISLEQLLDAIDALPGLERFGFDVVVINDGSPAAATIAFDRKRFAHIRSIEIVNLICNLGHQRAIAVGLVVANAMQGIEGVIVMDCDGEDQPVDIPRLIAAAMETPGHVICARRARRSESLGFRFFYFLYKFIFRGLAGTTIDFGNFCYIPRSAVTSLAHSPNLWNHLAAALVRSQLPLVRMQTERGRRYSGKSSMKLSTLVVHGLSAVSVYSDIVVVRLIIGMLGVSALTTVGLLLVAIIRIFTDLAIPGWASTMIGSLSIVLLQSLIFAAISAFMLLSGRSAKLVIPAIDAPQFIASKEHHDTMMREAVAPP